MMLQSGATQQTRRKRHSGLTRLMKSPIIMILSERVTRRKALDVCRLPPDESLYHGQGYSYFMKMVLKPETQMR